MISIRINFCGDLNMKNAVVVSWNMKITSFIQQFVFPHNTVEGVVPTSVFVSTKIKSLNGEDLH